MLRLARLQHGQDRGQDAIETLQRALRELPDESSEPVLREMLARLRESGNEEGQLEVLGLLARQCADASARAGYRLERARLLIDGMGRLNGVVAFGTIPKSIMRSNRFWPSAS